MDESTGSCHHTGCVRIVVNPVLDTVLPMHFTQYVCYSCSQDRTGHGSGRSRDTEWR